MRTTRICLLITVITLLLPAMVMAALTIKNPGVQSVKFNPANGDTVQLTYSLNSSAKVRIRVYSPDDISVRTLINWDIRSTGKHNETWDGKDDRGTVVPDEAYYFTIEVKDSKGLTCIYDPTQASGGDELEMADLKYDAKANQMTFTLKRPSRIMVRAGLADGPLMRTPVDWIPFDKGIQQIAWDGKDESETFNVGTRGDLKLYGIGYILPDCTVVARGNTALGYKNYLTALPKTVFRKPYTAPVVRKVAISPFWGRPPRYHRAIRFTLSKPEIVDGKLKATIAILPDDVALLRGVAYEVIAYMDKTQLLDDERGHSPYSLALDISKIPAGEHLLTVNVASVTDRVGTQSQRFSTTQVSLR